MRIALLASGSSGNSLLIRSGRTSVLVDAGISARRLSRSVRESGADPGAIGAVLVTHEHSDHVCGLPVLARETRVPVIATAGTLREIGPALPACCETSVVSAGARFDVWDLTVSVFPVSHDAAEPVGFSITDGAHRVAVATDLGMVGPDAREHLRAADCVVLECNHDERMLLDGPYPWHLKQRVLGDTGHLSNGAASREIERLGDGPLSTLVLAHLSRRNNTPDLAHEAAAGALRRAGRPDVSVLVAAPFAVVGPFDAAGVSERVTAQANTAERRCGE